MGYRLRMTDGKEIVEVRPVSNIHKGTAVILLGQRLHAFDENSSVLFVGDDRTDEDAFRSLRAYFPRAVTIRVDDKGEDKTVHTTTPLRKQPPDCCRHAGRCKALCADR